MDNNRGLQNLAEGISNAIKSSQYSYLSRMFQEQAGRSFSDTVKDFKLRKAAELLKTKNWKLDQICDEIGYSDTRQFIRSFKQMFGVTPDRFRKVEQQTVHQQQSS